MKVDIKTVDEAQTASVNSRKTTEQATFINKEEDKETKQKIKQYDNKKYVGNLMTFYYTNGDPLIVIGLYILIF